MMAIAIAMPTFAQFDGSRNTKNRFNHSNVEQYYGVRLGYNLATIKAVSPSVRSMVFSWLTACHYGWRLACSTPKRVERPTISRQ